MDASTAPEVIRRPVPAHMAHVVSSISCYRERGLGLTNFRHAAPLALPLLISLGSPFRIALGRDPDRADTQPSFAAGLFPGPVQIESDGRAICIQVDFTPLGAYRFYGGAVPDLTARMVDIRDLLGRDGRELGERVAEAEGWQQRLEIIETFVLERTVNEPSPAIAAAIGWLWRSAGAARISEIATDIGWSRKHLSRRFQNEIGVSPKTLARMLRFHRACELARSGSACGWAGIALEAGFADQAHLAREFREFSGERPTSWAARLANMDPHLMREAGG
ncbi:MULTISPECIES: helix-turn-helix domain-containing protein [unclassified Bradyrhizobium]|jgi:AraC-like DNA-binding protein|uniref:helix-turn-helix domain-containing protein n=1 Tax=unclassified Bradyrhizobium TaxID=2631580 RepID=UPI00230358FB|nr:helix-turn-helix domain-containing protein [Bradyrhizobium sp. CCBAU 25338]MDA9528267.1 AraC family transcriptional regulator [Bradyrhizobium sp. CCBAU 25338]